MSNLEKRNWNKIVSESRGQLIFLPEGFVKAAEEWKELRGDYNKFVATMAKKEMTLNETFQNIFFELRRYLEKNGQPDIYLKDIGFETTALEDGKFIVSIREASQNQVPQK